MCPWHHVQVQESAVCIPGQEPLTASMLAAAPLHEQKQMIGEWPVPLLWSEGRGAESWLAWWETPSGGQMSGQGPALPLTKQLGDLGRVASAF